MKLQSMTHKLLLAALTATLAMAGTASGKNLLYTPDGRVLHIKGGALQPDLSLYRSPLESKVVDRRFYTNDATYMANEGFKIGMEGFDDFVKAGIPVAYRRGFQWITAKEIYFYARYLLDYTGARGHAGVHMIHAPYFTMQALRLSAYNRVQRDRGERVFSNKDVLLGIILPNVYQRIGFPRVFDDIQISYLQYKSVDPHFTGHLDTNDDFDDPMSGKKGGWGVPNTYLNDYQQRFDHDKMDTTFDMGAIGQFLKRRMQWSDYFFHSEHKEASAVSMGREVNMLGNDAEEGMRGWGLTLASTNTLLELKSAMFTDGKHLMGINPVKYDPAQGLRYIPHEIEPNILWVGDIPERVWSMTVKDASSQLWDQSAWIWGTTAYATTVKRRPKVFTDNPPVDGGFVEKNMGLVAEAVANSIFKNMRAMHMRDGLLVSQWTPQGHAGDTIAMRDMMMALAALHDMEQSWEFLEKYPETAEQVRAVIDKNARFLLQVQGADGSFYHRYRVTNPQGLDGNTANADQWAGIRALLAAYFSTEDEAYLHAARKTFNLLNSQYWVEAQGVYRSRLHDDTVVVDPYGIGVAMGAMREMLFATPAHLTGAQMERFSRWWVQTVDTSGAMQSENHRTGEIYTGFISGDDDGDGVPYTSQGDGNNGIAPVIAGKVVINVGGASNRAFGKIDAPLNNPSKFKPLRTAYVEKTAAEQAAILVRERYPREPGMVDRDVMERVDSTVIPLQAAIPIKTGLGTRLNLTGAQIFDANCSNCHGQHGEGIDGLPLTQDIERTHQAMFKIVNSGRVDKFMPAWGVGSGDGFGGPLTKAEIDKVVDYVQSPGFRDRHQRAEKGEVVEGARPKDVWFYLSRENAKAHGKKISTAADARRYYKQHADPAKLTAPWYFNIQRVKPDAQTTEVDLPALRRANGLQ